MGDLSVGCRAVNPEPTTAKADFLLSGVSGHNNATQPLLWDALDRHPQAIMVAIAELTGGRSSFTSYLPPTSTTIFRLGCEVATRPGNLLPNADMEAPSAPGNVYGWGLSIADNTRDPVLYHANSHIYITSNSYI